MSRWKSRRSICRRLGNRDRGESTGRRSVCLSGTATNMRRIRQLLCVAVRRRKRIFGAIGSAPIADGQITHTDTWAGRGGFGSKLLQQHHICAIIYGGSFVDDDFRDRKVADQWFVDRYESASKQSISKPRPNTGSIRGSKQEGRSASTTPRWAAASCTSITASIYDAEEDRLAVHEKFIKNHYLQQFNQETIVPKQQTTCGEPCAAVCKKAARRIQERL